MLMYNISNPKSYLIKYKSDTFEISNNLYKKDIYKVSFEINGKIEIIYFNINKSQFEIN